MATRNPERPARRSLRTPEELQVKIEERPDNNQSLQEFEDSLDQDDEADCHMISPKLEDDRQPGQFGNLSNQEKAWVLVLCESGREEEDYWGIIRAVAKLDDKAGVEKTDIGAGPKRIFEALHNRRCDAGKLAHVVADILKQKGEPQAHNQVLPSFTPAPAVMPSMNTTQPQVQAFQCTTPLRDAHALWKYYCPSTDDWYTLGGQYQVTVTAAARLAWEVFSGELKDQWYAYRKEWKNRRRNVYDCDDCRRLKQRCVEYVLRPDSEYARKLAEYVVSGKASEKGNEKVRKVQRKGAEKASTKSKPSTVASDPPASQAALGTTHEQIEMPVTPGTNENSTGALSTERSPPFRPNAENGDAEALSPAPARACNADNEILASDRSPRTPVQREVRSPMSTWEHRQPPREPLAQRSLPSFSSRAASNFGDADKRESAAAQVFAATSSPVRQHQADGIDLALQTAASSPFRSSSRLAQSTAAGQSATALRACRQQTEPTQAYRQSGDLGCSHTDRRTPRSPFERSEQGASAPVYTERKGTFGATHGELGVKTGHDSSPQFKSPSLQQPKRVGDSAPQSAGVPTQPKKRPVGQQADIPLPKRIKASPSEATDKDVSPGPTTTTASPDENQFRHTECPIVKPEKDDDFDSTARGQAIAKQKVLGNTLGACARSPPYRAYRVQAKHPERSLLLRFDTIAEQRVSFGRIQTACNRLGGRHDTFRGLVCKGKYGIIVLSHSEVVAGLVGRDLEVPTQEEDPARANFVWNLRPLPVKAPQLYRARLPNSSEGTRMSAFPLERALSEVAKLINIPVYTRRCVKDEAQLLFAFARPPGWFGAPLPVTTENGHRTTFELEYQEKGDEMGEQKCPFCNKGHSIFKCRRYRSIDVPTAADTEFPGMFLKDAPQL